MMYMEKERFEEITESLIKTYRNYGEDELNAERDRINKELASDLLRLDVQGGGWGVTR